MHIRWTKKAEAELWSAYTYVAQDNLSAADRQLEAIEAAVKNLSSFPEMGRPGRIAGTRELVVQGTPYIVAYRLRLNSVRILSVMHGARRWPGRFL